MPFFFRAILLLAICLFMFSCFDELSYEEELQQIAEQVNKKCPRMLDSETRLDGIEIKQPNTLVYKYTLVNIEVANVDTQQFNRALWPGLVSNIRVSYDMKKLRDNQTIVHYAYVDKANKPISTITITPQNYK